jgi:TadE-like protein
MVEFAILMPFLFSIVLGGVDFGRVFGQNAAILGAAREAARQTIAFDPTTRTNPDFDPSGGHDTAILTIAQNELGSSGGSALSLAPIAHRHDCAFTAASPPPTSLFPGINDSGYLFICWAGAGQDGAQHVRITIAWTMSLLTPFVQNMVGTPHLHAVVEATEQSG